MGNPGGAIAIVEDAIELAHKRPKSYTDLLLQAYQHLTIYRILAGHFNAAYDAGREMLRRIIGVPANNEARMMGILAMAILAALRGQAPRAARLWGALDAFAARPSSDGTSPGGPIFDQCRALLAKTVASMLDPPEIDRLQLEGRSLSIDMAMTETSLV